MADTKKHTGAAAFKFLLRNARAGFKVAADLAVADNKFNSKPLRPWPSIKPVADIDSLAEDLFGTKRKAA